ncbi:MAG: AraC family transcriptional regulator [Pseudomonadota bacterium]
MDLNATPERGPPVACLENSDAVETRHVASFSDRRFRAYRMVQRSHGVVKAESSRDHALIHQIGGGTGYRHDGPRRIGRTDISAPTTMLPAGQSTAWDLSEGVDLLQIPVSDDALRRHALQDFDIDPQRLELQERVGVDDPFMNDFANIVLRELSSDHPATPLLFEGLTILASGHILRTYSNLSDLIVARAETDIDRQDRAAVRHAWEVLRDNLDRNIAIDDLARDVGLSPFRLMRAFKAEMGRPIHRFVMEIRVAYVRDRLLGTDDRLIDIAIDAGFANQSHMTSVYRALMGVSPGRHRRQMRH